MFIGHFAVGFGAKAAAPRVSLGIFFIAAQLLDLLWPILLLLGFEHVEIDPGNTAFTPLHFTHYPITHSLLMVMVWGTLFAGVYWLWKKDMKAAIVLGLCVVSHWVLDLLVHGPDLPLYPGDSPLLGLGIWNSIGATVLVESIIFLAGLAYYFKTTRPRNKAGIYGTWGLILFLVAIYIMNMLGPPPPDKMAIAWAGNLQWLLVIWAFWVDKNREVRPKKMQ